jgi:hypothetical protein
VGAGDFITNTVMTSDATYTTIATVPIAASTSVLIDVKVSGFRTNGTDQGYYIRRGGFVNRGGTVTQQGGTQSDFTRESVGNYDTRFLISGTDVLIQVRGQTAHDVEWTSKHMTVEAS